MKLQLVSLFLAALASVEAFAPNITPVRGQTSLQAKYNTMDEILALFPEEMPVLINFYDAGTEAQIKDSIFQTKTMLKDRATLVSIKQQDYPDLAKLWDANEKSPSMILFKDGSPVKRIYEKTDYLDIISQISQYTQGD